MSLKQGDLIGDVKIRKTDLKLYLYIFVSFLFLITVGIKAVKGEIDFEFYGDSETYIEFVKDNPAINEFVFLYPNMLGPSVILILFMGSFIGVYAFNVSILLFFYFRLSKLYNVDRKVLLFYIVISSMFFSSLIAVNKEILSVLVITLFFSYFRSKSLLTLLLAILISFLVRWQMALFVISLAILLSPLNIIRKRRITTLVIFLIFVSVLYYLNMARFEDINLVAERGAESSTEGSGLFNLLLSIQNSSPLGYVFVFLPKTLFLFIGLLARYYKFFDYSDFYNNVIVFTQSLAHLIVLIMLIRRRVKLENVFVFSALVYFIIFALSPIYAPRYLFPAYLLLSLGLATSQSRLYLSNKTQL